MVRYATLPYPSGTLRERERCANANAARTLTHDGGVAQLKWWNRFDHWIGRKSLRPYVSGRNSNSSN